MKKLMICFIISGMLYACGGNGGNSTTTESTEKTEDAKDITDDPEFIAGRDLVNKSDCLGCHKVDDNSTGPAYRSVANKYPNTPATIDTLAHKIIKGGSGNWGSIPMAAHPNISEADAKAMAKYILLLKK